MKKLAYIMIGFAASVILSVKAFAIDINTVAPDRIPAICKRIHEITSDPVTGIQMGLQNVINFEDNFINGPKTCRDRKRRLFEILQYCQVEDSKPRCTIERNDHYFFVAKDGEDYAHGGWHGTYNAVKRIKEMRHECSKSRMSTCTFKTNDQYRKTILTMDDKHITSGSIDYLIRTMKEDLNGVCVRTGNKCGLKNISGTKYSIVMNGLQLYDSEKYGVDNALKLYRDMNFMCDNSQTTCTLQKKASGYSGLEVLMNGERLMWFNKNESAFAFFRKIRPF